MSVRRKRFVQSCHFIGLASRGKSVLERAPSNSLICPDSLVSFAAILIGPDVLGDISISEDMAPPKQFVIDEKRLSYRKEICISFRSDNLIKYYLCSRQENLLYINKIFNSLEYHNKFVIIHLFIKIYNIHKNIKNT